MIKRPLIFFCAMAASCAIAACSEDETGAPRAADATACPQIWITTVVPGSPSRRASLTAQLSPRPDGVTYTWSVSAGEIVRGQGTSMMFVEAPPGPVTATLEIGGLGAGCNNLASETVAIE